MPHSTQLTSTLLGGAVLQVVGAVLPEQVILLPLAQSCVARTTNQMVSIQRRQQPLAATRSSTLVTVHVRPQYHITLVLGEHGHVSGGSLLAIHEVAIPSTR